MQRNGDDVKARGRTAGHRTVRGLALSILIGVAALPVEALAITNTKSDDGVTPSLVAGNPADCAAAGISGAATLTDNSNSTGSQSDANGATLNVTSDGTTFSFTATLPGSDMILGVLAKGGSAGGNLYDYRTLPAGGVLSDGNLHPPPTGNGAQFAGLSHILFCYGLAVPHNNGGGGTNNGGGGTTTSPGSTPTTTPTATPTTTFTSGTSSTKGVHTKKHKKHKKHHVKAKKISRPAKRLPTFTG
jgi:hypothetical protein